MRKTTMRLVGGGAAAVMLAGAAVGWQLDRRQESDYQHTTQVLQVWASERGEGEACRQLEVMGEPLAWTKLEPIMEGQASRSALAEFMAICYLTGQTAAP